MQWTKGTRKPPKLFHFFVVLLVLAIGILVSSHFQPKHTGRSLTKTRNDSRFGPLHPEKGSLASAKPAAKSSKDAKLGVRADGAVGKIDDVAPGEEESADGEPNEDVVEPVDPAGETGQLPQEMMAMGNVEIVNSIENATWMKPVPLPLAEEVPWSKLQGWKKESCAHPVAKPQRMYVYNSPVRTLRSFMNNTGYLLYKQGEIVPNSINPIPIVHSKGWNASRPMGRWKARWIPDPKPFPPTRSQVTMAESEMYVMVFQNAWVYRGSVMQCTRYFAPGACSGLLEPIRNYTYLPEKENFIGEKAVAFCDRNCRGYYHWTHEQLPRLFLLYDLLKKDPDLEVLFPVSKTEPRGHITQTLVGVLGLLPKQLRWVPWRKTSYYKTVYYPQPQRCGSVLTPTLLLMRKIVFGKLDLPAHRSPKDPDSMLVVFADRNDIRQPKNHPDILRAVKAAFPRVRFVSHMTVENSTQKRSVKMQMQLFNEADMVIGPHGANLANIMWCKFGTPVLEYVFDRTGNMCYYQTGSKIGLEYRFVIIKGEQRSTKPVLDPQEVVQHVREVHQRMGAEWQAHKALGS